MEQGYSNYPQYIKRHTGAVRDAFYYLKEIGAFNEFPESDVDECERLVLDHDHSKYGDAEWDAYNEYFYGGVKSFEVVENFKKAWLHHIHKNEHHWQHWVLIGDDESEGTSALDIPNKHLMEMICDWFSFSIMNHDIYNIVRWYNEHKDRIILHPDTRAKVEYIINYIINDNEGKEGNDYVS